MNLPTKLEITEAGLCDIIIYCIYVKRQINFERLCLGCHSKSVLLNTPYFWTPSNSVDICLAWSCFGSNRFTSFQDILPFLVLLFIRSTTSYIGLIFYNWALACHDSTFFKIISVFCLAQYIYNVVRTTRLWNRLIVILVYSHFSSSYTLKIKRLKSQIAYKLPKYQRAWTRHQQPSEVDELKLNNSYMIVNLQCSII